jgi:hypothetical protein
MTPINASNTLQCVATPAEGVSGLTDPRAGWHLGPDLLVSLSFKASYQDSAIYYTKVTPLHVSWTRLEDCHHRDDPIPVTMDELGSTNAHADRVSDTGKERGRYGLSSWNNGGGGGVGGATRGIGGMR